MYVLYTGHTRAPLTPMKIRIHFPFPPTYRQPSEDEICGSTTSLSSAYVVQVGRRVRAA